MDSLVIASKTGKGDVTTSLIIAQVFGRRHDNVLRDIQALECSAEFRLLNFEESYYMNGQNKAMPMYEVTKDGFSFLVMGYTGEKAAAFKEKFISEFNKRELMLQDEDYILTRSQEILTSRVKRLEEKIMQKDTVLELQEAELKKAAPKVEYFDKVLESDGTIITNVIAKEMGMSAVSLNKLLHQLRIIYKQGDTWLLYHNYQSHGLAKTRTYTYTTDKGETKTSIQLVWTEKGRLFIHEQVDKHLQIVGHKAH